MTRLFVVTHNICHMGLNPFDRTELFPDRTYRNGYEAHTVETMRRRWQALYSSFSADLIGLQEYFPWFDLAHTCRTEDEVFAPFGYTVSDGGHGLALAAKYPAEPVYETSFAPISERRQQKYRVTVGTRQIAVFNSHPMPRSPETRQQEYAALIRAFQSEQTFIAFGDYNAVEMEEYACFREAGFPMANSGFITTESRHPCDNIVVSPNIRIEHVEMLDRELTVSDHAPLLAELLIP